MPKESWIMLLEAVGRENCRILECVSEEDGQRDGEKQTAVFNHFHLWVRERLRQGGNPEEELNAFLEREPDCIIISDEIGCGIVPLEPEERGIPGENRQDPDSACVPRRGGGSGSMRNRKENQIDLALIRHGMTASNSEKRYLGRTNEPLSEEGRRLLLLRKEQGCYPAASFLFSGPMTRCLQTGRLLYPEKTPLLIPEWTEMDFGEFEGKNYRELSGDARYQAWIDSGGLLPFPGGESREAFLLRCRKGLERLLRMLEKKGQERWRGTWRPPSSTAARSWRF